ncbi:MAG: DUF370 domain-containing protein [Tissierellia bacterium]|nr:DUF370 domain-containing protein [Tissierellia bacterium]
MNLIDLGNNTIVNIDDIVAIIDSTAAIESKENHNLFIEFEKSGNMIYCTNPNFIRSFVFCEDEDGKRIYSSSFTTKKLKDRLIFNSI